MPPFSNRGDPDQLQPCKRYSRDTKSLLVVIIRGVGSSVQAPLVEELFPSLRNISDGSRPSDPLRSICLGSLHGYGYTSIIVEYGVV